MKKALKKALKEPKEKKEVYKGSKVTPRHPRPGAQAVFQVPVATTPKPWIALAKKRRLEARDEDTTGQWDALAGSRHGRSNLKSSGRRQGGLRDTEAAHNLGVALALAAPLPSCAEFVEEEAESENESIEESMIQERANDLSRFESSRVEMRDKDTLVVIAFDGSKEFFKRVEQTMMAKKTHSFPS